MKKLVIFFVTCVLLSACNGADSSADASLYEKSLKAKGENEVRVVSPDGYIVSKSEGDLKKILFNGDINLYNIERVDFVKLNKSDGALAYVNYKIDGVSANLAFAIGNVNVGYRNSGGVALKKKKIPVNLIQGSGSGNDKVTVYKCKGLGCCYVGGETNLNTGQHTFYCKCENNSDQNSSCSLEITEISEDKTLNPN